MLSAGTTVRHGFRDEESQRLRVRDAEVIYRLDWTMARDMFVMNIAVTRCQTRQQATVRGTVRVPARMTVRTVSEKGVIATTVTTTTMSCVCHKELSFR